MCVTAAADVLGLGQPLLDHVFFVEDSTLKELGLFVCLCFLSRLCVCVRGCERVGHVCCDMRV